MIYGFLDARLWESASVEHRSLLVARIYRRRSSNFGIRLPDFGVGDHHWIPAKQARTWPVPESDIGTPESSLAKFQQNQPESCHCH